MMNIIFRADASIDIGTGHVMRCLTLADALGERGAQIRFICRNEKGNLIDYIDKRGYCVDQLSVGINMQDDAQQTLASIKALSLVPDWLIVDHYGIESSWEAYQRRAVKKIMVIDDLANRLHECDILLDQNYTSDAMRYEFLVPHDCIRLLGPKYSLLRKNFHKVRRNLREHTGQVKRILVFMGGSDPNNETSKVLEALKLSGREDIDIDIVIGASNPHWEQIRSLALAIPKSSIHTQVDDMASLMGQSDFSIGGGGSTTWERCCLGLPGIAIVIAANQIELTQSLEDIGAILNVGGGNSSDGPSLLSCINKVLYDKNLLIRMADIGKSLVDGRGTSRVSLYITEKYSISIATDAKSWIGKYVVRLKQKLENEGHSVVVVTDVNDLPEGDIAFFLGCSQIAPIEILERNIHNLVVHESNLPEGKGWSPLTWQIIEGKNIIPITLIEASATVDSGPIYIQDTMKYEGHELVNELRETQGKMTVDLCMHFVSRYADMARGAREQKGEETFYPRRSPNDSRLDMNKTIVEQFNLLRVVDNDRYPAFFEYKGKRFVLKIEKA